MPLWDMKHSDTLLLERSVYRSPVFSKLQHNLRNPSHSLNSHCRIHTSHESLLHHNHPLIHLSRIPLPPQHSLTHPCSFNPARLTRPSYPWSYPVQGPSSAPRCPFPRAGSCPFRSRRSRCRNRTPPVSRITIIISTSASVFSLSLSLSVCQINVDSVLLGGALSPGDSVHPFFRVEM